MRQNLQLGKIIGSIDYSYQAKAVSHKGFLACLFSKVEINSCMQG